MDSGIFFWYVIERISSAAGSVLHITGELSLYKGGRNRNVIRINFGGSLRTDISHRQPDLQKTHSGSSEKNVA